MTAYTRRRLIASVKLGAAAVPFSVLARMLHGQPLVPGTFLVGFAGGFTVGAAELFWLRSKFSRLEVVVAQIGELKREIVYSGEVLNTTARIQAQCNVLGHTLLVSAGLVERLELGSSYRVEPLGRVPLRGKEEAVELCAVERAI